MEREIEDRDKGIRWREGERGDNREWGGGPEGAVSSSVENRNSLASLGSKGKNRNLSCLPVPTTRVVVYRLMRNLRRILLFFLFLFINYGSSTFPGDTRARPPEPKSVPMFLGTAERVCCLLVLLQ